MDKNKRNFRFLITGGHFTPALAVIAELQKRGYKDLVWVGRKKTMRGDKSFSAEYKKIAEEMKIPFFNFQTSKIIRFSNIATFFDFITNLIVLPIGFIRAFLILIQSKPTLIISFGGHLAVPIVMIGKVLKIPSVTHEQTVVTGLANKIIARFVNKILISWDQSYEYFDKKKTVLTGNPIRKEVLISSTDKFKLNPNLKTIYVTGGNQGAHIINTYIFEILPRLLKNFNVIHQTGGNTLTKDFYVGETKEKNYRGKTNGIYISEANIFGTEIGEVFSKADIFISRSGANTLTEFLALGKLSVIIPIPWSINNEQLKNAKMLEDLGLSVVIEEKDLKSEILFDGINTLVKNLEKGLGTNNKSLTELLPVARSKIKLNAAELIVDEVLKVSM